MHDIWEIRRTKELLLKLFGGTATTLKTVKKEHFYMFFYFDEKESNMEAKGFSGNEIQEDKTIVGSDASTPIWYCQQLPTWVWFITIRTCLGGAVYVLSWP